VAAAPEAWLRGPIPGIDPMLMPAAHALAQASEDLERAAGLSVPELWATPGGAASVGFHLQHIRGSVGRLLTYARGRALNPDQMRELAAEGQPGDPPADAGTLIGAARRAIAETLEAFRTMRREELFAARTVGRRALPTNAFGLLFHLAEHAQRHAGQVVTTAKIVSARA
jgi:DinB family protein